MSSPKATISSLEESCAWIDCRVPTPVEAYDKLQSELERIVADLKVSSDPTMQNKGGGTEGVTRRVSLTSKSPYLAFQC